MFPESTEPAVLVNRSRSVPWWQEGRSTLSIAHFARTLVEKGRHRAVVVGCDPLSFLQAAAACRLAQLEMVASAVWFVDWSAHRLERLPSATAYRTVSRLALRTADFAAAVTPAAASAIRELSRSRREITILRNQPLSPKVVHPWRGRPERVVYVGGLSDHQGLSILLGAAEVLDREGISVAIAGDGPGARHVADAAARLGHVWFRGLVEDPDELTTLLQRSKVGLALYDPAFAQYRFGDALKIRDYLAAGLRVVSTLPTSVDDGIVSHVHYSIESVVKATRRALTEAPLFHPSGHPLVIEAGDTLKLFLAAVEDYVAVRSDDAGFDCPDG